MQTQGLQRGALGRTNDKINIFGDNQKQKGTFALASKAKKSFKQFKKNSIPYLFVVRRCWEVRQLCQVLIVLVPHN